RSPKDRFVVRDAVTENTIDWGAVNQPIEPEVFDKLLHKVEKHLLSKDEIFSFKGFAGADEKYRLDIEVINEYAWHNLFARTMFIEPTEEELKNHKTGFTVINAPSFLADPKVDGTNSEAFILISFTKNI